MDVDPSRCPARARWKTLIGSAHWLPGRVVNAGFLLRRHFREISEQLEYERMTPRAMAVPSGEIFDDVELREAFSASIGRD